MHNSCIRDRGFAYFRTGAVEILEHTESHIDARVKGSQVYLVRLTLGRASLQFTSFLGIVRWRLDLRNITSEDLMLLLS